MKKRENILLAFILILAGIVRFFYLDRIPAGFLPEEVSNGWNAYSLLKTGKDEWGNLLPLTFRESGSYRLPFASYLMTVPISLFGLNEFAIRLTAVIGGISSIWLTYLITDKLLRNKNLGLTAAFFLSISPWHIAISRYGMEVILGLAVFLSGLYFFLKSQRSAYWLIPSAILFSLSYYTYQSYTVFTLLFVILLIIITPQVRKMRGFFIFFILLQLIALLPYLSNPSLSIRYQQTIFINDLGIKNRIHEHRQACLTVYPGIFCRAFYNQPLSLSVEKLRNYINHYSTTTYFLYGSSFGLSSMPERWGFLYLLDFPLLIIGLIYLIKRKTFPKIIFSWLIIFAIPSASSSEGHIWRMVTLLPVPQIIAAIGLYQLVAPLRKKHLIQIGTTLFICGFFLLYLADYFVYFPYAQGRYSYYGFRDLYKYLKNKESDYDQIIIAPTNLGLDQLYIYFLFYTQYNPSLYQAGKDVEKVESKEGWVYVKRIGKWHFVKNFSEINFPLTIKSVFVTDGSWKENEWPYLNSKLKFLQTIYYRTNNPAFEVFAAE